MGARAGVVASTVMWGPIPAESLQAFLPALLGHYGVLYFAGIVRALQSALFLNPFSQSLTLSACLCVFVYVCARAQERERERMSFIHLTSFPLDK